MAGIESIRTTSYYSTDPVKPTGYTPEEQRRSVIIEEVSPKEAGPLKTRTLGDYKITTQGYNELHYGYSGTGYTENFHRAIIEKGDLTITLIEERGWFDRDTIICQKKSGEQVYAAQYNNRDPNADSWTYCERKYFQSYMDYKDNKDKDKSRVNQTDIKTIIKSAYGKWGKSEEKEEKKSFEIYSSIIFKFTELLPDENYYGGPKYIGAVSGNIFSGAELPIRSIMLR